MVVGRKPIECVWSGGLWAAHNPLAFMAHIKTTQIIIAKGLWAGPQLLRLQLPTKWFLPTTGPGVAPGPMFCWPSVIGMLCGWGGLWAGCHTAHNRKQAFARHRHQNHEASVVICCGKTIWRPVSQRICGDLFECRGTEHFRPTTILQQSTTPSQTTLNVKTLTDDPARVFEVWPSHHLCTRREASTSWRWSPGSPASQRSCADWNSELGG
jgi:hypothetical protein